MWEQYRRTFWATQIGIATATAAVLTWSRLIALAALFFVTMQLGAVVGGLWAGRLKRKFALPLGQPATPTISPKRPHAAVNHLFT